MKPLKTETAMTDKDVKKIESAIGYVFNDKQLLKTAFTHSSFLNENRDCDTSYDRLEFLGDAVLDFLVSEELYFRLNKDEGEMTEIRSQIVSKEPLCNAVDEMGIFGFMRIGKGAGKDVNKSPKVKSDLFESLLAAVYIDCGRQLSAPREFLKRNLTGGLNTSDYKSELQNYTQKRLNGIKPEYEDLEMSDGRPVFRVCVKINGVVYGKGEGSSKKKAQQNAAKEALSKIKS